MSVGKMHAGEQETDVALVRRLLAAQFPQWAELPVAPVPSAGTDNALYRLGDELCVRLPRIGWAVGQIEKERVWLPRLAPQLPHAIPQPLAMGEPDEGYPWQWAVYRWLAGEMATLDRIAERELLAVDVARFVTALHRIDASGGLGAWQYSSSRGVPLATRDAETRGAIEASRGMIDTDAATAAWDVAVQTPVWERPPVWVHGDLQSGNLLTVDGRLSAVIDFGCLGIGDPAVDLIVAWNLFTAEMRGVFRTALGVDDDTWARGRGWALSTSVIALPYYHVTNPVLAGIARYAIGEVLAERGG